MKQDLIPSPLGSGTQKSSVDVCVTDEHSRPSQFSLISQVFQLSLKLLYVRWVFPLFLRFRRFPSEEISGYIRQQPGIYVRQFLEKRGGLWVKIGQLLALRRDMFSDEFCEALSDLHDRVPAFSGIVAKKIIAESWSCDLDVHLEYFDEVPVAAASIGQVHRARLRHNGIWVAIKVQRPHIDVDMQRDLSLIKRVARLMEYWSIASYLNTSELVSEMEFVLREEIDYRIEAASIKRMRRNLKRHKVYCPKVYTEYCSKRVLVMEFLEGVYMSEYIGAFYSNPSVLQQWLDKNNVDPVLVRERLMLTILRQIFEDNLFHGDLHPGNILLLRNSRFAFIDFGSIGFMESSVQKLYRKLFLSIIQKNYSKMADLLFLLSSPIPEVEVEEIKPNLVRRMKAWAQRAESQGLDYHEKSFSNAFDEIVRVLFEYKITLDWSFFRIDRAFLTLDASACVLDPDPKDLVLLEKYFTQARKRVEKQAFRLKNVHDKIVDAVVSLEDLPENAGESVFYYTEMLRRRMLSFQSSIGKLPAFIAIILAGASMLLSLGMILMIMTFGYLFFFDTIYSFVFAPLLSLLSLDGGFARLVESIRKVVPSNSLLWLLILFITWNMKRTINKVRKHLSQREISTFRREI